MLRMVKFNLGSLMQKHQVTIRELSRRSGITQKRIREIRKMTRVDYLVCCDLHEKVTGKNIFSRERYDKLCRIEAQSYA